VASNVQVLEIEVDKLAISPLNVRREVGDITELADSIREEGVLQPVLARPSADGYELIAGSRRLAAAKQVGIAVVPAVVRDLTDAQAVAASLTENLQRGELSLEERVEAYKKLQALDPAKCGSTRGLAKAVGRNQPKIVQDFEAYEALQRLRPQGIQVITQLSPAAGQRQRGEAIPERHATMLEQAFASVRTSGNLSPEEADSKYAEIAREIAPLDHDDARKVLDQFKMYPERSVSNIKARALAKVDREVSLDLGTARRLDELASSTGRRWEDVIATLVESPAQTPAPAQNSLSLPSAEPQVAPIPRDEGPAAPRYEPLELPEESPSEQIIGKTLWNIEQAERAGVRWDFYTIGYSQKTIEQFVRVLQDRGVCTLVDIRHDPVSMYKPDFSKDNLRRALEGQDIAYIHMPDLGVPREVRARLARSRDWAELFQWYDDNVVPRLGNGAVSRLQETAKPPMAFMCVEQNPRQCHRHRMALALGAMGLNGADL
jgi:ParB/RepB/Spo0J family partition protein